MKNNELIAIILIVLIVTVGIYFTAGVIFQQKPSGSITTPPSQPTLMIPQTTVSPVSLVVTTNTESTSPVVTIRSQECEPDNHNFPVVKTVLKNNGETAITNNLVLKIYSEADVTLGTFPKTVTIPPHGEVSTEIIMYGTNYFQAHSMSTEFPGLEQTPPPRKNSGYQCPAFRKA